MAEPVPDRRRRDLEGGRQPRDVEALLVVAVLQPEPHEFARIIHCPAGYRTRTRGKGSRTARTGGDRGRIAIATTCMLQLTADGSP